MATWRHWRARGALPLAIALWAGAAHGQPAERVRIDWQAPAPCPDDVELLGEVERFLGQPLKETREQQLAIEARIAAASKAGYVARLTFASAQGVMLRELEHTDCRKLTEAAALLMALAIDPERVELARQEAQAVAAPRAEPAPVEPAKPPEAPASQPSGSSVTRTSADSPQPAKPPAFRARLGVFGLVGAGVLPQAAPGVGVDLALRVDWFEAALGGRWYAARTAEVPGAPGASVELSLSSASLRACALPWRRTVLVRACAQGQLGSMSGSGQGVDDARSQSDPWLAVGGEAAVAYVLGRFSPLVGLEAGWSAVRPRFGVSTSAGQLEVFQARAWQLAGFVGIAYTL